VRRAAPAVSPRAEDQLSALGLIVNVIVLWNTIYMDAALQQLRKEGFEVRDEDVARLSPLGHEHINMLGRYTFSLPDKIAREAATPQESWRTPEPDFLFRCYSDPNNKKESDPAAIATRLLARYVDTSTTRLSACSWRAIPACASQRRQV
jgi:hypothetical protein